MRKFEDIRKLPPQQRVAALKLLSDEFKKKIEESKRHIKDREKEIDELTELLERAQEELQVLEHIETPKPKEIKIEDLFKPEKNVDKNSKGANLESQVMREPIKLTPQEEIKANILAYKPTEDLYAEFKELYGRKAELDNKEREKFYTLAGALEKQYERAKTGNKEVDEEDWQRMTAAEKMMHYKRKDMDYKR